MKLALAGDTMLGRGVAQRQAANPSLALLGADVLDVVHEADLFVLNLECCISDRGEPWPDPRKPFFFRAPPVAAEVLASLGVDCVTLANNHALDFGREAFLDTLAYLHAAGIACAGAGESERTARAPVLLRARDGFRLAVTGVADHPAEYAAGPDLAGIAYADVASGLPGWLVDAVTVEAEAVLVTPHWGPNMTPRPSSAIRAAGQALLRAGATLVAGHSAHVFHGVEGRILYDLGDFIDDYAVHPVLRNDLGLLWLVTLNEGGPSALEALPLRLECAHTRLATGDDAAWIRRRLGAACRAFGTQVEYRNGRLTIAFDADDER